MVNNISVHIKYKLKDVDLWHEKNLAYSEYFDLEENEEPALDSVPIYMHAIEYLTEPSTNIEFTIISIVDKKSNNQLEIKETFWNKGKNRIIERVDKIQNDIVFNEIIIQIAHTERKIETIRFERQYRINKLIFHSIDQD
jgi:hypothetical protein